MVKYGRFLNCKFSSNEFGLVIPISNQNGFYTMSQRSIRDFFLNKNRENDAKEKETEEEKEEEKEKDEEKDEEKGREKPSKRKREGDEIEFSKKPSCSDGNLIL